MFCHKCGAQMEEGQVFCHKCGTKVVLAQEPITDEVMNDSAADVPIETVEPEAQAEASESAENLPIAASDDKTECVLIEPDVIEAAPDSASDVPDDAVAAPLSENIYSPERAEALLDLAIAIEDIIRLKCPSCGAINSENAKFCFKCGATSRNDQPSEKEEPRVIVEPATPMIAHPQNVYAPDNRSYTSARPQVGYDNPVTGDVCPYCGARDSEIFTKSYKEVYNKYFGCSDACCGYICLGPIGILCGFCGAEHSSSERTEKWHRCRNCGKVFRDRKEASDKLSGLAVGCVCLGALFAGIVSIMLWTHSLSWITGLLALGIIAVWVECSSERRRSPITRY